MRLFEIVLILLCLSDGFSRIRFADRRPIWISIIPLVSFLCGIIHVAVEGARWQMLPVYLTVVSTFVMLLVRAFQTGEIPLGAGKRSRLAGKVEIMLTALSMICGTALPVFDMPTPTGDYIVGFRDIHLCERIVIRVRYPSDKPAGMRAPYGLGNLDEHRVYLADRFGIPPSLLGHLSQVRTYAFPGASLSHELPRYRLLIGEPETGRPSTHATGLADDLASHGFVVISLLGSAVSDSDSALTVGAEAIVEHLEALDPQGNAGWLADRLDLARVGIYGFHAAGETVIDACRGGTFRAGAVIGSRTELGNPDVPFLYLRPEDVEGRPLTEVVATTYVVSARGMLTGNFGDDALLSPLMPALGSFGSIDPYRGSRITSAYLGAFFNKHLTRGTVEPILDGPSAEYPEISIQIHDSQE